MMRGERAGGRGRDSLTWSIWVKIHLLWYWRGRRVRIRIVLKMLEGCGCVRKGGCSIDLWIVSGERRVARCLRS